MNRRKQLLYASIQFLVVSKPNKFSFFRITFVVRKEFFRQNYGPLTQFRSKGDVGQKSTKKTEPKTLFFNKANSTVPR